MSGEVFGTEGELDGRARGEEDRTGTYRALALLALVAMLRG
jgi:hypothetical protein